MLPEILKCERLTSIVDVGASPIDGEPPYKAMLDAGLCSVVGFDPQDHPDAGPNQAYRKEIIGNGSANTFSTCVAPGMSSMLFPYYPNLQCFPGFPGWGTIVGQRDEVTRRLDGLIDGPMDFLRLDIQGAELDALDGADWLLKTTVAVQTEVSFVPLYFNQPTFGETDIYLRAAGFLPHHFVNIKRWPIAPARTMKPNQLLEADIVYVRDFTKMDAMSDEQLKHLAMIAHYCYGSHDLVVRCLHFLMKRGAVQEADIGSYVDKTNA